VNWQPGAPRPLSEEDRASWTARIDRADRFRKQKEPRWDKALKSYDDIKADNYDVNALLPFRHVESKKAQLFYQTPEVQLHPIDPQNPELPIEQIIPLRQRWLNHQLGPEGTKVHKTVQKALFDALAPAGVLPTEIGFEARTVQTPAVDEAGAPVLGEDGQPQMTTTVVWGRPYWVRFSPKKLLIPDDFRDTDFDEAPWLGVKGTMPLAAAKRQWTLPEDFSATTTRDEGVFEYGETKDNGDPMVEYTKIWYRAELYDETVLNPELYRRLIFVKGVDDPVEHVDSPFQEVDPQGQLSPRSMRGNPIHPGVLRDLSDSAWVRSDLDVGEPLSNEVNKFRTQLIRNRVARTPFTFIDPQNLPKEAVDKINNGEKVIITEPGGLAQGANTIVATANPGTEPRDNYAAQEYAEKDWQGALGTNQNTAGQTSSKKTTATESRIVATKADARAESEKDRLREWFVAGVRKFDTVLQWTSTPQDLMKVLGSQGANLYQQWAQLPGCYAYKILPDSGVHVDAQQFRAQKLDEYNLLRKDPLINGPELVKQTARALAYDPVKMVLPQQPEQGPEPIKSNIALKGEDLIGPQSQAIVEILAQQGIAISPAAIQTLKMAQLLVQQGVMGPDGGPPKAPTPPAEHGGGANRTEPINQHQRERTGGVQGVQ